ncbi:MAG TPA: two-component regulator propeller domain-containing protein, partial [Cyclobacteriaceae bacterium]|nr:two-component regulator propeller domain-containing protein [Cyclobacteriaceae bacterium]
IYDREKDNFIDIDSIAGNRNHLINKYITALCFDRKGKLWIGTHGNGLHIYDPQTLTFTYLADGAEKQVLSTNYITSVLLVDDKMWVGTKGGLKLFDPYELQPVRLPDIDQDIMSKEITQLVRDQSGNIWMATEDKEIIELIPEQSNYSVKKTKLEQNRYGEGADNILTICIDASGNLWAGGVNAGLNYLNAKSHKLIHYWAEEGNPKKLPSNSIRYVYVDNEGLTWIGTYEHGVYLIDSHAKKFDVYDRNIITKKGLPGNNVKGLAEDSDGNIWIACDGGGLVKLDSKTNELEFHETINKNLGTKYLSALLCDTQGNLWIGTWGRGVYRLNPKTLDLKNYQIKSNGFGDNRIFSLYEDKENKIWVGSIGSGLYYKDLNTDQFTLLAEEKKTDHVSKTAYVTSMLEDEHNTFWVTTLAGVHKINRERGNSYRYTRYVNNNQPDDIGSNEILTIHLDPKKNIWLGSSDNGISILADGSSLFKGIRKQDGMVSNAVKGILTDETGDMWFSSSSGLIKYNPSSGSFRNYTVEDGLPSNEFNGNSVLKARNGKFYFGSPKGLVAFYPDSIRDNPIKPVIYLTDLKLNNQSARVGAEDSPLQKHISLTKEIELHYSQRSFVLDFAAINYGQSSRNQYCYKLEGFDKDWNCVGANHSATYTNLDPGHYVFLVKASTNDGIASDSLAQIEIDIDTAPWKTWWAILLYLTLITVIIFFLVKLRLERIKIKSQLEFERLAREKEHALSESKTQFFTNISHEFRTPLSLIAMPLESLIMTSSLPTTVKERLDTIRASVGKMMRLVNELMDFNKLESTTLKLRVQQGELVQFITNIAAAFKDLAEKKSIHFGKHSMLRSLDGWFDHDKLEKILVNVLSNAFKFTSHNGQINIVINARDSIMGIKQEKTRCLELIIIDNGIGIPANELPFIFDKFYQAKSSPKIANSGTGIGLSLTKGLIELHHGSITVESTPDRETKFIILLPIDRHMFIDDDVYEAPGYIAGSDSLDSGEFKPGCGQDDMMHRDDKPQILIVEDNDELRKYISLELREQFHVLVAKDGQEGLEIATEKTPDLIVCDVLMPLKTGIELCSEIKSNLKTSHIPFILLTAKTTLEDQIAGIAAGADIYITKPFSIRFLIAQVNQIITSRKKLYSRFSKDVYLLPAKVTGNEIDQTFLQKAITYIIENIQDPQMSVDSIASLFNLSRMQTYRKVKALTGKSVVDFIRMVRIKQALKLMESQQFTLSEIAFQT